MMRRLFLISLGCPKNRVDSEYCLGLFSEIGGELVLNPEDADYVIVNTCAFIRPAVEESIETILELAELKKEKQFKLIVSGCLPGRYKEELIKELPEVDAFLGPEPFHELKEALEALENGKKYISLNTKNYKKNNQIPTRISSISPFYAYLKISEGCSNSCSYCTIPLIRGPKRSRSFDILVSEAQKLVASGIKEIIIVGQDITDYKYQNKDLISLLKELDKIEDLKWIRLLYLHPKRITKKLLEHINYSSKIVPYFDIPIQHASDRILNLMGRGYNQKDLESIFQKIRKTIPNASLRTTVMVGFPGETDKDFEVLLKFIEKIKFDHLGSFIFYPEEGTPAALYKKQIPLKIKEERYKLIMEKQQLISLEKNKEKVGKIIDVLIEGISEEKGDFIGRGYHQAPEIDGYTYIKANSLQLGNIIPIKITNFKEYDLIGKPI